MNIELQCYLLVDDIHSWSPRMGSPFPMRLIVRAEPLLCFSLSTSIPSLIWELWEIKFRLPELWLFLFSAPQGISVLKNRFPCIAPGHCLLNHRVTKLGFLSTADMSFRGVTALPKDHDLTGGLWGPWLVLRVGLCLVTGLPPFLLIRFLPPTPRDCVAGAAFGLDSFFLAYYPSFPVTFQLFSYCLREFLKPAILSLKQSVLSLTDFSH